MASDAWPMSTLGWVEKLQKYAPQVLEKIDSGQETVTITAEDFRCGHKQPLASVLQATVGLAEVCNVTLIFKPS